jgi:GR25 family glycosyltransferase involved in LPS biosynthesis
LESRPDRNEEILSEINKVGLLNKTTRINAVQEISGRGSLGCTKSHIIALETFINSGHNNCIIFEDDFIFVKNLELVKKQFYKLFTNQIDYDLVMLETGRSKKLIKTKYKFLLRSKCTHHSGGYLITKAFAPVLLQNFKESAELLEQDYENKIPHSKHKKHILDHYWCKLQGKNTKWYIFKPIVGKQSGSQSNIR